MVKQNQGTIRTLHRTIKEKMGLVRRNTVALGQPDTPLTAQQISIREELRLINQRRVTLGNDRNLDRADIVPTQRLSRVNATIATQETRIAAMQGLIADIDKLLLTLPQQQQ